jgi:Dolichyl-phosphate-mannose-protein mannosyltransferase
MRPDRRTVLSVAGLFALALAARVVVAAAVPFPASEDSAYYVGVARNLLEGRGLVSDAMWSFATPPLTLPQPAFQLWMPVATFLAAIPMALFGTTFAAAQVSSVLLGAIAAPMTWLIARDAAEATGIDPRRARSVALGSGILVAVLGPLLIAGAVPDSTTPFLVFALAVAILTPRALAPGSRRAGIALGLSLGLAYLSRSEAVWLAIAVVILVLRTVPSGARLRTLSPIVVTGAITVTPWLVRNALTFGSPLAGQALQNALLTRNEQIFAWDEPATVSGFLGQGLAGIAGNDVAAVVHQLVSVLLVPAFPIGLVGIAALVLMRRSPAFRAGTALNALLLGGLLTFVATAFIFPIATLWGTFLHASGPLLAGLTVCAMLGTDAALARLRTWRGWSRQNAWLAPAALLAVAVPLAALEAVSLAAQSTAQRDRVAAVAQAVRNLPGVTSGGPLISDHPVWLSDALGVPVLALPDEPAASIDDLVRHFGAQLVIVLDQRGRYPDALFTAAGRPCNFGTPIPVGPADQPAYVVGVGVGCAA